MTGRDERVKSSTVTEIDDDKALADPILTDLFAALRTVGSGAVPTIGDELRLALNGVGAMARARRRRALIRFGAAGLVSAGVVAGGLSAAAANDLPAPVQRVVSVVVGTLTPFDLPNPDQQGSVHNQQDGPADSPGDQPGQDSQTPGTTGGPDGQGGPSGQNEGGNLGGAPNSGGSGEGDSGVGQDGANQGASQGSSSDDPGTSSSAGQSGSQTSGSGQAQNTGDQRSGSIQTPSTGAGNDNGASGSDQNGAGGE